MPLLGAFQKAMEVGSVAGFWVDGGEGGLRRCGGRKGRMELR